MFPRIGRFFLVALFVFSVFPALAEFDSREKVFLLLYAGIIVYFIFSNLHYFLTGALILIGSYYALKEIGSRRGIKIGPIIFSVLVALSYGAFLGIVKLSLPHFPLFLKVKMLKRESLGQLLIPVVSYEEVEHQLSKEPLEDIIKYRFLNFDFYIEENRDRNILRELIRLLNENPERFEDVSHYIKKIIFPSSSRTVPDFDDSLGILKSDKFILNTTSHALCKSFISRENFDKNITDYPRIGELLSEKIKTDSGFLKPNCMRAMMLGNIDRETLRKNLSLYIDSIDKYWQMEELVEFMLWLPREFMKNFESEILFKVDVLSDSERPSYMQYLPYLIFGKCQTLFEKIGDKEMVKLIKYRPRSICETGLESKDFKTCTVNASGSKSAGMAAFMLLKKIIDNKECRPDELKKDKFGWIKTQYWQ